MKLVVNDNVKSQLLFICIMTMQFIKSDKAETVAALKWARATLVAFEPWQPKL